MTRAVSAQGSSGWVADGCQSGTGILVRRVVMPPQTGTSAAKRSGWR